MQTSNHSRTHQSIGKLIDFRYNKRNTELHLQAENGFAKVLVYHPQIIRITLNRTTDLWDFSYATIVPPLDDTPAQIAERNDKLILTTSDLKVVIYKNPLLFAFYDPNDLLINADEPFSNSWLGEQISAYKTLQPNEKFIGLGEKTGNLDRKGTGYTNYNTDFFAYYSAADPLYISTPFYMGVHSGISYGIFLDNSSKTHFNFGASNDRFASFTVESGDLNYYFIYGKTIAKNIELYTYLTGRMELPPLWSLGYHQCRYSYYPDKEVLNIARTFREKQIPADVIYLDIHYMQNYKLFTWSKEHFAEPQKLIQALQALGFKVVVIIDPGIKVEQEYETYQKGVQADVFLKYPDGTYYTGQVWPGWCHFPDFTNPRVRKWWGEQFAELVQLGIKGFWNDMNEIATWGNRLPELIEFDLEGHKASTRQARNLYGLQMARATFEGIKKLLPQERTFHLTRAGFSGVQRYACVWTGDNVATDEHLLLGVRLVNSMGLAGLCFAGYDVGGFVGEASNQLFAKWISIGAFSPFFRGHKEVNTASAEPWTKGRQTEEIARNYISLRYRLIPYIYSHFYESTQNGLPIQRSLAIDYTHDDLIYHPNYQNQYLFGKSLLICPNESYHQFTKVYLPEASAWYYWYDGKVFEGKQEIVVESPVHQLPIFVRASAIIPMQSLTQHLSEKPEKTLHLHIYFGQETSEFLYYEDDGTSYEYKQGNFYKRLIRFEPQKRTLSFEPAEGNYTSHFEKLKIYFHHFQQISQDVKINGKLQSVHPEEVQFIKAISSFDPMGKTYPEVKTQAKTIEILNTTQKIEIIW
ncbi:MAG: DUF4968 domain-containing protein [Bacteroidia bacterium]|nr:DUF4968 domain-containing protein [Bacteroidia bacterium]MDW8300818.1 glycoside hydrolase family 31 protein [Bacteroidia bacterium]